MLTEGTEAPAFALPGYHDGEVGEFALDDYVGEDVVVVAFYPMDFSPGCTEELCSLRDIDLLTLMDDVTILGVSGDSVHSHRAFAEANALEFPLLTDSIGAVAEEYGVLHPELDGHLRVPKRALFVVDDRGRVAYAWSTDDPTVQPDLDAVRDAIDGVQDDRTAAERYGRGYQHYTYGRSEFENALGAYDRENWLDAVAAFEEAVAYFDSAGGAFDSARRFAESEHVHDAAATARDASDDFRQAATWLASAAEHRIEGKGGLADECHADAQRPHESARQVGELPDPDALVPD
ncbi:redoxin domain-containing protein [Halorubellus sp. PRR65]|uniref:redoxin domain-containing protein n=1 Tax=Halorubellus sp. PRR65 TaxID=3098148 RepID=UPI002B2636B4|nr:redoxin domain-containing protein [Halorubellus sp. PRR65]